MYVSLSLSLYIHIYIYIYIYKAARRWGSPAKSSSGNLDRPWELRPVSPRMNNSNRTDNTTRLINMPAYASIYILSPKP